MLTKDLDERLVAEGDGGGAIHANRQRLSSQPSSRSSSRPSSRPSIRPPSTMMIGVDQTASASEMTDLSYIPQHPLPPEIGAMPRDDTVCKFCGVSYLIHNEIKKLEEELKAAMKKIETLEGARERLKEVEEVGAMELNSI